MPATRARRLHWGFARSSEETLMYLRGLFWLSAALLVFSTVVPAQELESGQSAPAAETDAPTATVDSANDSTGALTIRSEPSGALVIVDGFPIGSTPVKVDSLPAGKHRLQIALDGYFTRSATVVVRAGRDQEATFELTAPASITVLADTPEAVVSLNGEQAGPTPHTADMLRPGEYRVTVAVEGAAPYDTTLALAAGGADTVRAVFASPEPATAAAAPADGARSNRIGRKIAAITAAAFFGVFALVVLIVDAAND
ncbi:MAG: PEGA domain-containing protein [Chitinivibrionales bacterium]|nr:PEGA domain-containing protein [Chitinivibrionales bacterium]